MSLPGDESKPKTIQVGITELKHALWKADFRALFPELKDPINVFLSNPNCACNQPLYNTLLQETERLERFFGCKVEITVAPVTKKELQGKIFVINTNTETLEGELRKLPVGPKYISIARFENQITAVVQLLN